MKYIMNTRVLIKNVVSKVRSLSTQKTDIIYKNPCLSLQQYLEVPLLDENELSFNPNIQTMKSAQDLFIPKPGHKIKRIASTIDVNQFPSSDLPEVAFIGKSNAGKSSLVKAMFKDVPNLLVKTSKKPGHTKSAQFFQVGSKLCLVDMPGYGNNQPEWFTDVVESYLMYRRNLVRTFLLIDAKAGFYGEDDIALDMLEEFRIPYAIIMTKIDTASDSTILKNLLHLKKIKEKHTSVCCFSQPYLLSSHTYEGLACFLAFIGHITGNLNLEVDGSTC